MTAVVELVAGADGVTRVVGGVPLGGTVGAPAPINTGGEFDSAGYFFAEVAPCAAILEVPDCRDGQVFALAQTMIMNEKAAAQATITMDRLTGGAAAVVSGSRDTAAVTLPPLPAPCRAIRPVSMDTGTPRC